MLVKRILILILAAALTFYSLGIFSEGKQEILARAEMLERMEPLQLKGYPELLSKK